MNGPLKIETYAVARATFRAGSVEDVETALLSLREDRFTGVLTIRISQGGILGIEAEGRKTLDQ
jgi:hypothetical protein